jgi:hypothetical protein
MRDLTKSAFTFPWAISMLGVQQIVNLLTPPPEGRIAGSATSIDAVARAAEQQLDGWLDETLEIGNTVQRSLVDLTLLRPPSVDSSGLMRVATDRRWAPLFQATMEYGLPPVAWLDSFRLAREDSPAALQEFANKLRIIQLVTDVHAQLSLDKAGEEPLPAMVDRAAALQTFTRLWAVEEVGTFYADRELKREGGEDPQDLLTGDSTAALPAWSLTMLHAGIGMSFAKFVLGRLGSTPAPDAVRHAVTRFGALCRRSSRRGYAGVALESLGLAARTLHQKLVPLLDRDIAEVDPELHAYFWHGAGRAMYFDPTNMLPSSNGSRSMIANLEREAPHDLAYRNALAGISWETATVNMQNPEVMELFLRHHGALAARNDAFANGVSSAVVVRHDTTPRDEHIALFVGHEPRGNEAARSAWRTLVRSPCELALGQRYEELRQACALQDLFRYRPDRT